MRMLLPLAAALLAAAAALAAAKAPPRAPAAAPPADAQEALGRLESAEGSWRTLRARYRQQVVSPEAGPARPIEGTLELLKPGRLRLEDRRPERRTVVADGSRVWFYRRGPRKAVEGPQAAWREADAPLEALLDLGGYAALAARFEAAYSTASRTLTLTGERHGAPVTIALTLAGPSCFPSIIEVATAQLRVRTELSGLELGAAVPASRFRFTPPAGAEVERDFIPPKL